MIMLIVLSAFLSFSPIQCKVLPKYVTRCSMKNAEHFSRCVLNNAKTVFPKILNGDRNYKIPNLNLTFYNSTFQGLSTVDFKSVKYDKDGQRFVFDLTFDNLRFDTYYTIDGKILILPVVGKGPGFVDFRKPHLLFSFNLSSSKGKHGKVIRIVNPSIVSNVEKVIMYMDNLFNGNKALGDEVNKFLNENWKAVVTEFEEIIETTLSSIFIRILGTFLNDLTYDAAFDNE